MRSPRMAEGKDDDKWDLLAPLHKGDDNDGEEPAATSVPVPEKKNPHALRNEPIPDLSAFNDFFGSPLCHPRPNTPPTLTGEVVTDSTPQKKMTSAQQARWEKEQERLKEIAEEAERLLREEEEREYNAPLIPRLVFNDKTRAKMPSISPRDKLSYTSDKKYHKELERFHEKNPSLHKFLIMLHQQIITAKPDNILDFIAEEYLTEENSEVIRKEIQNQETKLRELM